MVVIASILCISFKLTLMHVQTYESQLTIYLEANNSKQLTCYPEIYTGEVCRDTLKMYQHCLTNNNGSQIYTPANGDQQQLEQQVTQLIGGLQFLTPSPECNETAIPFICFYYFGLCDSSGEILLPSATQCETVSNETCAREFQMAVTTLGSNALPQCENLPSTSQLNFTECAGKYCRYR